MRVPATLGMLLVLLASVARAGAEPYPHGRLPDDVTPTHYQLALAIDPRQPEFSGRTDIDVVVGAPTTMIWMHGLGLRVQEVSVSSAGRSLLARYEEIDHETGVARVVLTTAVPAGRATLHFRYRAPFQTLPQGLYRTRAGHDWYAYSQLEAIDARRVFPSFDEPRFKTPFDVSIETSGADRAIGNAPERIVTSLAGGRARREFQTTKPLPTYLLAFAVGPLDVSTTVLIPPNAARHEPLPLRVIATRGQAPRFAYALREVPSLIARLEQYFDIGFPYPKIDLIASPIHTGAMENAGAIVFGEALLLLDPGATPRQQSTFGAVAAHELAHQWFGDLVTPAWWDDIWLNESFAEWMGSKVADQWRPDLGIAQEQLDGTLGAMATDGLQAGRAVHQPLSDNLQIAAAFDSITYQKGAGVIGMTESYLGAERFRAGVRLHLRRHADGTATAAEFFAAMAEASGEPGLIEAFRTFIDQPGVPLVTVREAGDGTLALEQSRYRQLGSGAPGDALWKIPFCVQAYGAGAPAKVCTLLAERTGTLVLPPGARGVVVHPNADGAGYYRFAIDGAPLKALLTIGTTLPAREALVLADDAAAAFDAGRLGFAELYDVASVLARHPDRTAALNLGYRLEDIHDRLAPAATRPLLERALAQLYGQRLRALGYDLTPARYAAEPAEQQLLRRQLLGLVGLSGRDPDVRRTLAGAAERAAADPAAVEALFRWRIWAAGAQELGAPVVGALYKLATDSRDAQVRQDAGIALGYAGTEAVARDELGFVIDPRLDPIVAFTILSQQIAHPATRDAAWSWLAAHRDAAVDRLPAIFQSWTAGLGASFCSPTERRAFEDLLAARLRRASGGELELRRTLERIDHCIALRQASGDALQATLAPLLAEPGPRS
jgi:aminopeptidase N